MGMWQEDNRHGDGIVVTLDGMYFEGNFQHNKLTVSYVSRALTALFGNGAGAHGIRKISGVLTKIGKFDIVLMYAVSIAKLIPIIKLTLVYYEKR